MEDYPYKGKDKEIVYVPEPKEPEQAERTPISLLEQEIKGEPQQRTADIVMSDTLAFVATATATSQPSGSYTGGVGQSLQGNPPLTGGVPTGGGGGPPNPPAGGGGRGGGGPHPGAPPGRNPNPPPGGGGGGGGGGPPPGPQAPGNPLQGENGSLGGDSPTKFNGDRSKTEQFIKEFDIYRIINVTNKKMIVPASRVALALSFIKGPMVNTWTFNQAKDLSNKINGDPLRNIPPTTTPYDETLWTDFVQNFRNAFMHTTKKEDAYQELLKLEVKKRDIDLYIATFEDLIAQAEWERNAAGTIELFKGGLPTWLTHHIMLH